MENYGQTPTGLPDIPGGVAPWAFSQSSLTLPTPTPASLIPVPVPRPIPSLLPPFNFREPVKVITGKPHLDVFLESETLALLLAFTANLSESVKGKKLAEACHISETVKAILKVLETMSSWVDAIPPKEISARYGNPAFRDWHFKLEEEGPELMDSLLPDEMKDALVELYPYFSDSFGNMTRIDYGTGHEANFLAWLLCLHRIGLIVEEDFKAVVLKVFVAYLDLMRKLQTTYWLEPAGSHGVWGLDDYHFLPFIFGASQLIGHSHMKPKSIRDEEVVEVFARDYLFLQCVQFVKKVKKGPFQEHSPTLYDATAAVSWQKVYNGLMKMYQVELWGKVPIMQHFLFGSILPWPEKK